MSLSGDKISSKGDRIIISTCYFKRQSLERANNPLTHKLDITVFFIDTQSTLKSTVTLPSQSVQLNILGYWISCRPHPVIKLKSQ